ncbi:flippase [Thermococcus radiotolerans]|uniref:Polysaccharide biosynthesis protein n=1 Tax=Thermococcus radiotolerans TaxID=187880 RepID=A0A2Z2MZY9_9EURY|nr:flippase [Thermococcus radiotolerans]ASJ15375.1 polysaccharide biosynthesis protein [Thermococcus radiotolerans]
MSEASQILQKIARGTGIVFAGTIISMFFGFLSRAVIARYFSTGEYGVFNLALTVLSIVLVIATLGFQNALPREVAFYKEREPSKVGDLTSTALMIVAVNSLVWTAILFAGVESISRLFGDERLVGALRIAVFALPFWALTGVIISISRGFGRVREQVYFQNIIYPMLFMAFVVVGAFLELPFAFVFGAHVAAWGLTFLALMFSIRKDDLLKFRISLSSNLGKELVKFSIPLMLTGIAGFVMTWTDTLMLGYYLGSDVVGLYNGAAPIAKLLPIFLNSAGLIFPPLATVLYTHGKINELNRVYQILTKWIFLGTFPLFALIFLFPAATINLFFGAKYISAAPALQILALGFMFHTLLGLNGWSLIVIRESNFIMYSTLISAGINVALNILLIPHYGIEGAAVATTASYFAMNVLNSLRLYQKTGIHPLGQSYLKSLVIGFVLLGLVLGLHLRVSSIWCAIPILVVFTGVYLLLVLLSGSIDMEDVELLLVIEKRLGVELKVVKKILGRFV